jgi:epoxyqueuosine reductase QueG
VRVRWTAGSRNGKSRHLPEGLPLEPSFAKPSSEEAFLAREELDGLRLIEWMTQEEFSARFKGSPIKPAKRRDLLRNAAVALGKWGCRSRRRRSLR